MKPASEVGFELAHPHVDETHARVVLGAREFVLPLLSTWHLSRPYDVGPDARLTPRRLCDYLQAAAARDAADRGFSLERLGDDGLGWVMHRLHLEVEHWPAQGDRLTVDTWPSGRGAADALRDFEVQDQTGRPVARATTRWVVLDLERRRLRRLPAWLRALPLPDRPRALDSAFPDLPEVTDPEVTCPFRVRRDDLDMLGHVNNAVYVAWVTEAVPARLNEAAWLRSLEIAFQAETVLGDTVACESRAEGPDRWAHRLARGDTELARAVTRWA